MNLPSLLEQIKELPLLDQYSREVSEKTRDYFYRLLADKLLSEEEIKNYLSDLIIENERAAAFSRKYEGLVFHPNVANYKLARNEYSRMILEILNTQSK